MSTPPSLRDVLPDAAPPPGARERVRAGVPERVARLQRRRTRLGYAGVVAMAAVAVAATVALTPTRVEHVIGPPIVVPTPMLVPWPTVAPGAPLSPGLLSLPSGGRVLVRAGAGVALLRDDATSTILRLDTGVLAAHVEKRPPGRPFVVDAGDVRVEVVGTVFVVERDASARVSVTTLEGTVRVTAAGGTAGLVHAGESWPASARAASLTADEVALLHVGAPVTVRQKPAATPGSRFAAARAREESFDVAGALHAYRALADGDGVEAEDALYACARLLSERRRDPAAARTAWAEYRRRFPAGRYARAVDAQVLELALGDADWAGVRREADAFLAAHADDVRAPRFLLARAAAHAHAHECSDALADLAASHSGGPLATAVRDLCHSTPASP